MQLKPTVDSIHRVDQEITETKKVLKDREGDLQDLVESFPEFKALQEAQQALDLAKHNLKTKLEGTQGYTVLKEEVADTKFKLRDLKDILSHHVVAYYKETGKDQLDEGKSMAREVIVKGRLGKLKHYQESMFNG